MSGKDERKGLLGALEDVIEDVVEDVDTFLHPAPKAPPRPDLTDLPPWAGGDIVLEDNPLAEPTDQALIADVMIGVSRPYDLRHDEIGVFRHGWDTLQRIAHYTQDGKTDHAAVAALTARSTAAVDAAMPALKRVIEGQPSSLLGLSHVRRMPLDGRRYVIFSDHHYVYHGHRTNFFGHRGHVPIYADILRQYGDAGYHVIENGDVEDLLFTDPQSLPREAELRTHLSYEALVERRLECRLEQLGWILDDPLNAPLVEAARELAADGRLHRTIGNHDVDLGRAAFYARLLQTYPGLERPVDALLLEDASGTTRYAVLHGHQWDPHCNPTVSGRLSETITQNVGMYTGGPDRIWRWASDGVERWATGERPFRNDLALGAPDFVQALKQVAEALDGVKPHPSGLIGETMRQGSIDGWLETLIAIASRGNIAWDYFLHQDPVAAVLDEVLTGDRFFKIRLLDEQRICDELHRTFPVATPTLVLGHSHEVRLNPVSPNSGKVFPHYANTGTTGRFENLLWGLEIVDGKATLVGWSRASLPTGPVVRRVWQSSVSEGHGLVQALPEPAPIPV